MEWTDDMTVRLGRGTSARGLVLYLHAADRARARRRDVLGVLTERFALSFDDARLAMDRVGGGVARAASGNPANEPDPVKDPLAWTSYRFQLGLPVDDDDDALGPTIRERAAAEALLERARSGEPTRGTEDVAVALEVARVAASSQEPDQTRFHLLLEAATCLSVAAEACIDRLGHRTCAPEGSQEWVDAVALAAAARQVTATFAAQPDPGLEERGLGLAGRIVTQLLGQCHAFVGRAMIESARCIQRNGDPGRAASHVEAVLADFEGLLNQFAVEAPFDEHVIALEYLLDAVNLILEVRGSSTELDSLRTRTQHALARAPADWAGAPSLMLPSVLVELIEQGRWPSADAPWKDQDARPRISGELVEAIAPGEQHICLAQYPFHTIGDEIRGGNDFFRHEMAAPAELDPDLALIVADFGLGSDAPIVLDYRTDPARVLRLAWRSTAAPPGSDLDVVMDNHWVVMAETLEDFVERLRL